MSNNVDITAADFIVSLWGRRRREFARRYWLHLSRNQPRPAYEDCFGADGIARKLDRIWHEHSRGYDWKG